MRNYLLSLMLIFGLCRTAMSQQDSSIYSNQINQPDKPNPYKNIKSIPKIYLGLSTGINNFNGLVGFTVTGRMTESIFIRGGLGRGGWGTKVSGGFYYQPKAPKGIIFGLSYSRCAGGSNLEYTSQDPKNLSYSVDMVLDYNPINVVNLDAGYYWAYKNGNRLFISFGYGLRLTSFDDMITIKSPTNGRFTEFDKQVINLASPGGIMIGIGFEFGI